MALPVTARAIWRAAFALAAMTALAGCVHRYDIEKPGGTVEEERIDWGLCGGDYLPGNLQIATTDREAVFRCLEEKGYAVAPIGLFQW